MKLFAELIEDISFARNENRVMQLLSVYFETEHNVASRDEALNLLVGKYPKKAISSKELKNWTGELTGYPNWLIERSELEIGNSIKTLSLLLQSDEEKYEENSVSHWIIQISKLNNATDDEIKSFIKNELIRADPAQRVIILKLLTGTFKSPVSEKILAKCLSNVLKIEPEIGSLRLYDCKQNDQLNFNCLVTPQHGERNKIPLPFPKFITLSNPPDSLGNSANFEAIGYRDGIEVLLVKYETALFLWTRDLEIVSNNFPEIINTLAGQIDDFVIHGQLLPADSSCSLEALKNRIHKKTITSKDLKTARAVFSVWEIMKFDGISSINYQDISRDYFSGFDNFVLTNNIEFSSWETLGLSHKKCRQMGFSGIVLREKGTLGCYHLWKATSYSIKAVLIYVELDPMEIAGIKSITFGLGHLEEFVPIAKITDFSKAINVAELSAFVKENTIERFGPVRTISPRQVYELHFDSISLAKRRKSGMALSNVIIHKKVGDAVALADSLNILKTLV